MKSLETMVNEANVSNDIEALRKDYEDAGWLTGQEKKDMIAKYNVDSKKAKDIQHAILVKLQELRKNRKDFDKQDLADFSHLSETDTQYYEELKKENDEFVKYLLDVYEEDMKSKKYKDLFKWVNLKSFSGLSFSPHEKWLIKRYQKIREELESRDPSKVKAKEEVAYSIDVLVKKLGAELEDFKKEYLKKVDENAGIMYDKLPSVIKNLEEGLKKMKEDWEEKRKEIKNYMQRWYAEEPIRKQEKKLAQKKAIIKMYKTKKSFIDACHTDAEKTFRGNVDALAHRIYDKKFDVDKIKVDNVKNDPKIFQLMISDGSKKLFCRSVLAAQFSDKMIPHFRFIMTDRK